ncbi:MAG: TOTE conflict system archaeo-eukaryotic primase domain-containing protein [Bryobacteraceae bacterium]
MNYTIRALDEHARDYWALFVNRPAYTFQSKRPDAHSGRHNYFLAKEFLSDQAPGPPQGPPKHLDEATMRAHLEGRLTVGLYAMNPETQRCKWLAIDADYEDALFHLAELQYEMTKQGIDVVVEQSRRGGHLWIFLEKPCLALEGRHFISYLARQLRVPIKGKRSSDGTMQGDGIEIFPKHDALRPGQFGNGMRGPLGVHQATGLRYWFYGADDFTLAAQLAYLKERRKLTEAELRSFLDRLPPPEPEPKPVAAVASRSSRFEDRPQFTILDHVTVDTRRILSGNYVAQCPSCAAQGRDKHGDNLHIKVADPRFYQCRAGCDRYAIREALGCPIPAVTGAAR